MPSLTLVTENSQQQFAFSAGTSILEILAKANIKLGAVCAGHGYCGLCRIRLLEGQDSPITAIEEFKLSSEQLREGQRLACQVHPLADLRIKLEAPLNLLRWKILQHLHKSAVSVDADYGLAVDLGTTHIRVSLWNIGQQRRVIAWSTFNPQFRYGADVLSRLMAAIESEAQAAELSLLVKQALQTLLKNLPKLTVSLRQIKQMLIVANTPLLALLAQKNYAKLLEPEYWTHPLDCELEQSEDWQNFFGFSADTAISLIAPLAGFVGSDLLVGLLATDLTANSDYRLLIDFGTNTELALWDGQRIWVSSVPGGPAFEGCGISCGMAAEKGAIYQANYEHERLTDYQVIGATEPVGLCGSGLIDVIAGLLKAGKLSRNGRFIHQQTAEDFLHLKNQHSLSLKKSDIDIFQRAKAATATAIVELLEKAEVSLAQLDKLYVCGAFGQFLNIENAQALGLLPPLAPEKVQLFAHSALGGCELLLGRPEQLQRLEQLKKQAQIVNMAYLSNFDEHFVENLYLQPIRCVEK